MRERKRERRRKRETDRQSVCDTSGGRERDKEREGKSGVCVGKSCIVKKIMIIQVNQLDSEPT